MPAGQALYWLWGIWYASWLTSLLWAGRPETRPAWRDHGPYQMATLIGLLLLFGPPVEDASPIRLWTTPEPAGWIFFALTAVAFAFCWWARIEMGPLWNGYVSRNANHRVIDTGPFAIVRHPIYTGIIAAAFLMAFELGTALALAGAAFFLIAFWLKARLEERFLRSELGPEAYDAYRRRVPMLVPLGPKAV